MERDRVAGGGLAGQHAEAGTEGGVEAVDQYNVANIEAEQHCKPRIVALNHIGAKAAKPASARRRMARGRDDHRTEAGALSRSRATARGADRRGTGSNRQRPQYGPADLSRIDEPQLGGVLFPQRLGALPPTFP